MFVFIRVCMFHVCVCVMYVCTYHYVCVRVYYVCRVCMCVYMNAFVCMYVYVCARVRVRTTYVQSFMIRLFIYFLMLQITIVDN